LTVDGVDLSGEKQKTKGRRGTKRKEKPRKREKMRDGKKKTYDMMGE
jgi:hypothetical protein